MLVPYRALASGRFPAWTALTYEQIVQQPEAVIQWLAERLDLPCVNAMLSQVRRPSRTVTESTVERVTEPSYLLARWRKQVEEPEERELLSIATAFGIDLYAPVRDTAVAHFLENFET